MENIFKKAGLIEAGINSDGEQEYIGTKKQWEKYQEILEHIELGKIGSEIIGIPEHDCHFSEDDGCEVCAEFLKENNLL